MGGGEEAMLISGEAKLDPLVGQLIQGRYHVLSKLSTGRTGAVYLAQISTGTKVAVKVLEDEYAQDKVFVERFRQLMLAVAGLSEHNANIVRVFDCEQAEDGRLFIAMEHLEGRLLHEIIRQEGALDIERALFLAEQMAEGLSAAHAAGILHTDVRPENFMIVGRIEAIKVLGFERARVAGVGPMDSLVRSGVMPRTPEYSAPEQVEGKGISRQTDIYALGVILYQMLTGRVPFKASTPGEVLAMHLQQAPTPPRQLRPEIPTVLEAKVLQALEKEPHRRESYANDVVNPSLRELVMEQLQGGPVRETKGLISGARVSLQTATGGARGLSSMNGQVQAGGKLAPLTRIQGANGGARRFATKHRRMAVRWKFAAIIGLLIFVAVPPLWMASARRVPEAPSAQSPQPIPDAAQGQGPGPAIASEPEEKAGEMSPLSLREGTPPETPSAESTSQETNAPGEKKSTAPPKQRQAKPPKSSRIVAAPRSEPPNVRVPAAKAEPPSTSPDPTEVIDWLLQHR